MRIHPSLTALLVGAVTSACDNTFQLPTLSPLPPSANASGVWGGTIGTTSILNISITETPPAVAGDPGIITGTGTLKSATCERTVDVSGFGASPDYTLFLTETGSSAFEIQIDATLSTTGIGGPYTVTTGSALDACLPQPTGFTLLAPKTLGQIDGTYVGAWGPASAHVSLELQQSGTSVVGIANWELYACSQDAFFQGVLTGNKLVGTLVSLNLSDADFSVDVTWNSNNQTLKGPWTITKAGSTFLCGVGETDNMDLTLVTAPSPATGSPSTRSVYYLELESDGTAQELLIQFR